MPKQYTLNDLIQLAAHLRDPEVGCPWDVKQTFTSVVPLTLEEVYEVVDAIEREDYDNLKEELGDLLFQIIFYSQLGAEKDLFNMSDVISTIVAKLLRRHPHVFPTGKLDKPITSIDDRVKLNDEGLAAQWAKIKEEEKREGGKDKERGLLVDIPAALPALLRSFEIQKTMAKVGFDWPDYQGALQKLDEEVTECKQAIQNKNHNEIENELGDLFFTLVNLTRHFKLDPETVLRKTNRKIEQRFSFIESRLADQNKHFSDVSLDEMDEHWDKAKTMLKAE